jgi:hypothetical protein
MHIEWEGHVASLPESFDVDTYSITGGVCYLPLFLIIPMIITTIAKWMIRAVTTLTNRMIINCGNCIIIIFWYVRRKLHLQQ